MDINRLIALVPAPIEPIETGSLSGWNNVQNQLGFILPDDYKLCVSAYGTGLFAGFLCLYNPFSSAINLLKCSGDLLDLYRESQQEWPEFSPPFPAYPEPGGLYPWARTDNGDCLFWRTEGEPNSWSIVICDSKYSEQYDEYPFGVEDFLYSWMKHEIKPSVFPDVLAHQSPSFTRYIRSW